MYDDHAAERDARESLGRGRSAEPLGAENPGSGESPRRRATHSARAGAGTNGALNRSQVPRSPEDRPQRAGPRAPRRAEKQHAAEGEPEPRIHDVDGVAVEPRAPERHQPAHAVVVQPVERRVREDRERREISSHSGDTPIFTQTARTGTSSSGSEHERQHRKREHAVRPSPPELERGVAAGKARQHVDVGRVGAEHERGRRERRRAAQTRGRERGAGEGVRDRIHLSAVTPDHASIPVFVGLQLATCPIAARIAADRDRRGRSSRGRARSIA